MSLPESWASLIARGCSVTGCAAFNEHVQDMGLCLISPESYMVCWVPHAEVKSKYVFLVPLDGVGIEGDKCVG